MHPEKPQRYHYILFAICFLATAFGGLISTLMSVYLPVAVKDLLGKSDENELANISAYINAVFIFGGAIGGYLSGYICDKAGRKQGVIFSVACCGLFTVLTGYMPSWSGVVVCRLVSGFGLGGILVSTNIIMMEEWPVKSRAIFLGFLSISIPVGIFSAGLIDYLVASWRLGFMAGIVPLLIAALSYWLLQESVQWKSNRAAVSNTAPAVPIFSKDNRSALLMGSLIFGSMLIGLWAVFSWVPTWIQTLVTTGNAQQERGMSMMLFGIGGLTGGFLSGWLTNAIGPRKSMLLCFAVCFAMSFLLFKTNTAFSHIVLVEIAILALFFGASQGVLSVYIPLLFSVNVRGTATGFCFNIGRIFTAVAVLFVGVLVSDLGGYGNALFIFSWVFMIGLAATFFSDNTPVADTISIEQNQSTPAPAIASEAGIAGQPSSF